MATTDHAVIRALYNDDDTLMDAVKKTRAEGHRIQEVYTPFPVHGLDHAMGLAPTRLSIAGFIYGLLGLTTAISMTYYMMIVDWPMNIGGKPNFTWGLNMPAFVPIMFELTVFFTAHLMVWTFFLRSGLYPGRRPMNPDPRTTDDMFMMEVALKGDEAEMTRFLQETGAVEVTVAKH
jgi:hypothetical protein